MLFYIHVTILAPPKFNRILVAVTLVKNMKSICILINLYFLLKFGKFANKKIIMSDQCNNFNILKWIKDCLFLGHM